MGNSKRVLVALSAIVLIALSVWSIVGTLSGEPEKVRPTPTATDPVKFAAEQEGRRVEAEQHRLEEERRESEKLAVERQAQESELANLLDEKSGKRFRTLPDWARHIYINGENPAIFDTDGAGDSHGLADFKQTVEQVYAGKSRVVRGGMILLVDRQHRIWSIYQAVFYGFDGKKWIERRASISPSSNGSPPGEFLRRAWQDSKGNCWFIGGHEKQGGFAIHCYGANEQWSQSPIDKDMFDALRYDVRFVEYPNSRLLLCSTRPPSEIAEDRLAVLIFDGQKWARVSPRVCTAPDHSHRAIIPFADGSIGTICGGGKLWTYWPKEIRPPDMLQDVKALLVQLDDSEQSKREQAAKMLIAAGPAQAMAPVKAALAASPLPETKIRLEQILESLTAVEQDPVVQEHDHSILYGGRFSFEDCYLAGFSPSGEARLYVEDCVDHRDGAQYHRAFVSILPDGSWSVRAIPEKQWFSAGWKSIPTNEFIDAQGRIWINDTLRTNANNELESATPPGLNFNKILGEDAKGRIYVHTREGIVAIDESQAAPKGDLASTSYRFNILAIGPPSTSVWAYHIEGRQGELFRLTENGEWEPIEAGWEGPQTAPEAILPLKNGGVIIDHGIPRSFAALYDGKNWTRETNLRVLIRNQGKKLLSLVGKPLFNFDHYWLAANGKRLWYAQEYHDLKSPDDWESQEFFRTFQLLDGEKWYDLWPEIERRQREATGMPVRSVDGGAAMLLQCDGIKAIAKIMLSNNQVQFEKLADMPESIGGIDFAHAVETTKGEFWCSAPGASNTIYHYCMKPRPLAVDAFRLCRFSDPDVCT